MGTKTGIVAVIGTYDKNICKVGLPTTAENASAWPARDRFGLSDVEPAAAIIDDSLNILVHIFSRDQT